MFSVVFSLNIAVGNMSLRYVSVNFNQVMRSLVPGAVMVLGTIVFGKTFSLRKKLSVLPVMVGVALACLGDMTFTTLGLVTTVFCVILAALKVALSGEMLTGEMKLPPLDLLATMTPLALAQTFALALFLGELTDIHRRWDELIGSGAWPPVILSGLLSFTLNITSFKANKLTSPLTLSIVANVKQVLLIALSTVLFDVPVAPINAVGIVIVILGSMRYSMISLEEKSL
jgi:drug/metabolite transporter (DMT)-like permease